MLHQSIEHNFSICYTYVLQKSNPGTAAAVETKFAPSIFKIATNAYGAHATLNATIMIITIRVTFFSLRSTILAILPVALIEF